jgi:para-aminobenzoate synthetase / 4-amino-4-deoxychorismate lyase
MDKIKPQMGPVNTNEVLLRGRGEWLHFSNPYRLIAAENLEDVLPALHEIEQLVQANRWHAAGFLSYEAAPAFDPALQTHGKSAFPYLWFGLYPQPRMVRLPKPKGTKPMLDWRPTICREAYNSAITKIKDYIADGRTYQVNYTMRLQTEFSGNAWEFLLDLVERQNQYAAYIDTGEFVICSASPELFFRLDGNTILCRPMKGTAPRGRTTAEDQWQSEWLKQSAKNRAENVMIVDMVRNDLGRVAEVGSVSVPELFATERYPTLWQMTSTVSAKTDASLVEILTALFPCASITGAPKVSTMKLISELECTPRKIYTGAIGYLEPGRRAQFNVAIRTALIDREAEKAEYGVGGGIVWDSTSGDEYSEALLKAQVLNPQQRRFLLLETILWTPQAGFFLHDKHVGRLLDSANYFDFPVTRENLEGYLEEVSSRFQTPQRVRVLLDQDGLLSSESSPFEGAQAERPLNVELATQPVDSDNVFLFHKTTHRDMYESARRGRAHLEDALLYNERGELTEFTIGNLVVELDGQLYTPPLACGVLAGTFRAHVLEMGLVAERAIRVEQLAHCTKLFRINSIRGWQPVELQK